MKNKNKKEIPLSIEQRTIKSAQQYMAENQKLLEKYGVRATQVVMFPRHKRQPLLSTFGLWLVRLQGGRLDTRLEIATKK